MIESFRLYNYKAFSDTKLIDIKPLTLLLGKNNSGKSSLLKALSFLKEGLAIGVHSKLSLKPAEGIRMGGNLFDIFHRREFVDLGFYVKFTGGIQYEVRLLSADGEIRQSGYSLTIPEHVLESVQSPDLYKEMTGLFPLKYAEECTDLFKFNVHHIGPLRVLPPEIISLADSSDVKFVGYNGDKTYGILLNSYLNHTSLFTDVSDWFRENLDGISLVFKAIDPSGTNYTLNVERDGVEVSIADVGLGVIQVLPIITQTFIAEESTIIAIEQPALHLHPAAHAAVASRIAESSKTAGLRFVVESHSKNFLLGLRLEAITPDTKFTIDDAAIYYVDNEELPSNVKEIRINSDGSLTYWPTGVFGEDADLLDQIIDLR